MAEAGEPAVLIGPEQAYTTQGNNVIIGEPRVAPNVENNSGRKLVLEKDDEGKKMLKITTGSTQYLRCQWWLMTKYKQQKVDSQNWPLKKRESTPPKREDDKFKQLVVAQPATPPQRDAPRVSRWGPPIPPSVTPQWGPYGVWVSYPPTAPMHSQQRWGEPVGQVPRTSVFSRLNNGQLSISGASQDRVITSRTLTPQESGKVPMQQVYVPKKIEVPAVPPPRARPQSVVTISSMEAPVINHDGPIVIEEIPTSKQDEALKDVAGIEEKKRAEGDSSIDNPYGVLVPEVPDEEMVDYEATPERGEINVVVLSADYYIVADDSTATKFNFITESTVFQKPDDSANHLKPLLVKGHINGTLVHSMLVDSGAIVNLMPYLLYKKLGGTNEELIKTNMTISGVGGGVPIPTDASTLGGHDAIVCLSGRDLSSFEFISVTRQGFVPISLKPIDNRLNIIM
ncbi:unnamed protein product [Miscanthus lutarioriparius]|uniref:Uncharacterized protein n=1 Tax=Miscanthus lutarioriparius TaxID=422564 RepID=A0A811S2T6_9POAL|nr:unnamed protein product [Miscanthus lutarioriparius]